jgi:hypothetical protein
MMVPGKRERLSRDELVKQLGESLGLEKAQEAVAAQLVALGLQGISELDKQQTLQLLDAMATSSGLVGVVARFAKVRTILQFK